MPPQDGIYVPTLAVRASEMNGMEFLPGVSKDRMLPAFLLAPWANSKSLTRTVERIERAFPRRRYFLDFDRDYIPKDLDNSLAQIEWTNLRKPRDRFQAWRRFWMDHPMIMPCLQLEGQEKSEIKLQIEDIQSQGREFCLRVELRRVPENLEAAVDTLVEIGTADFTVMVEGGWIEDSLSMYASAHGIITRAFRNLDGRVPVVVSCTSMLKGFSEIEGVERVPFSNRQLLSDLKRNINRDIILYGDWGSTRPREDRFGQAPFPRIDYADVESWYIARNRERDWDYRRAANAIIVSRAWDGNLGIWGEEMIEATAANPEFAIDTPQKNVAARVNIHLHRQALYGSNVSGMNLDEDWVD